MDETIAIIGTGTMGAPMALNLVKSGFTVRAWNRSHAKVEPLSARGVAAMDSLDSALDGATCLITMLYDAKSVEETVGAHLDRLQRGAIWLQMTTVGSDGAKRLQELAEPAGIKYFDAPVLGTRAPAWDAKLTVLAAGPDDPDLRDRAAAIFGTVGQRIVWVERPQGGQRLKLVVNSWVLAATEAIAEALRLAAALGLDPALFTEAIAGTANDLPYAHVKAKMISEGNFEPSFALDNALKDAELIVAAAKATDTDMSVTEIVRRRLERASQAGHGEQDIAAIALA